MIRDMGNDLLLCLVLATVTTVSPAISRAQAADAIDEVQVTATRRPVASSKVSAALTLIPAEKIRFVKLTTDALATEVGVFLQQTTPGQGAAIIRGLKGSEVLHIVDGMRLNNAIFRNAPTQYLALISPATVERIEIIRGSPTSLYGSDAVGGVLQVITRTPSFDTPAMSWRGDFSLGFDTAERGQFIRASLDAGTNRVAGLVSIDYLEAGNRRIGGGERIGPSGYESQGVRAALSITPDIHSSWLFDFQSVRQPETPRVDELVAGFGQSEPSSAEFSFEPNARDFMHIRHTRDDGMLAANWTVDVAWQRITDDRRTRNIASPIRRTESNESDLFGIAMTANRDTGKRSWVAGAEYYHDIVSSRRFEENLTTGNINRVQARFPDGSTVDQASIFANLSQEMAARHNLSGGIRYSWVDINLAETERSASTSLKLDDISADMGWRFEVTDETQLVANLSYGFRAPNVFDLGTLGERPGNRFNIPNSTLKSERVTMVEAGIKHHGKRLSVEWVAWYLDYNDRLTSVLTGVVTADGRDVVQTQNLANARIWGFEAAVHYVLDERITLELILNQTLGEQQERGGNKVPADRIPPFNGRLGVDMQIGNSASVDAYIEFAASQDRLSPRDVRDVRINPLGTADWVTLNLVASTQPALNWSLNFGIENAADKQYRLHGSGIDAPGRNFFLNVRYSW